jgi:choline dehydrogenase-like flavoprotein
MDVKLLFHVPTSLEVVAQSTSWYALPPLKFVEGLSLMYAKMYTRASASDYDDFQAKGWTTKELLPLMRKHETYQRACNNPELHGSDGPIKVSFGNYTYPIKDDFLRAAESQGIPVTDDLQDLKTGYVLEQMSISNFSLTRSLIIDTAPSTG